MWVPISFVVRTFSEALHQNRRQRLNVKLYERIKEKKEVEKDEYV